MRWPGNRENDSLTAWRFAAVVMAVDSIEIVRILSNSFRRFHVDAACSATRRDAGSSRLLRAHQPEAPDAALDVARQARHARAGQRVPAGGMVVCRDSGSND